MIRTRIWIFYENLKVSDKLQFVVALSNVTHRQTEVCRTQTTTFNQQTDAALDIGAAILREIPRR